MMDGSCKVLKNMMLVVHLSDRLYLSYEHLHTVCKVFIDYLKHLTINKYTVAEPFNFATETVDQVTVTTCVA